MKIRLLKKVNVDTVITGFKGLGYVGYIVARYITSILNSEFIGVIDTVHIPPYILVKKGVIHHPYEIYNYKNILIPIFEDLSVGEETNILLKHFIDWSVKIGIQRFILIGGLDKSIMNPNDPPVKIITNKAWLNTYGNPAQLLNDEIRVLGPLAITFHYTSLANIPTIGILAFAEAGIEDYKAAAHAIEKLNNLLGLQIPIKDLLDEATLMEKSTIFKYEQKEDRGSGLYA